MRDILKRRAVVNDRKIIAVIDVGSTFIRMTIAENISGQGAHILDRLSQSVTLGRDIIKDRLVSPRTVDICISALSSYLDVLEEYGLTQEDVKAFAVSAVNDAENGEIFLDRLYGATGVRFVLLDPGQVGYYYHLAFRFAGSDETFNKKGENIVCEVGGTNCIVLGRKDGEIRFVQTYSVGTIPLRKQVDSASLGVRQLQDIAEGRTREIAVQIKENFRGVKLLFLGREIRLAAIRLRRGRALPSLGDASVKIKVNDLRKLLAEIGEESIEGIATGWRVTYSDAELLAPALSIVIAIADYLHVGDVRVSGLSFCDGLVEEAFSEVCGNPVENGMRRHIIRVARETGEKFHYDEKHAVRVAEISTQIFDLLSNEHNFGAKSRLLLETAALLHDVGVYVSAHGHHKHSMYLIRNTEFAGLSATDIDIVSQIARYHRKTMPKKTHTEFMNLTLDNRMLVSKMAAILRVADALDRVHDQSLGHIRFELDSESMLCIPEHRVSINAEKISLKEKSDLFERMFGRQCYIQSPS